MSDKNTLIESAAELEDIQMQIVELLDSAMAIIRKTDIPQIATRAQSYWCAHIKIALFNNSGYLGRSMCTFEDTIQEIYSQIEKLDAKDDQ
ncbi:hypothetical protein [Teredinibacter sp. KSP-S5-2]|uniref:hypothetical protein n=1 Tax=Teredinibacter sp. KSP-S5-2 TaxID=3034506 RepID=UPI0029344DFA|nr:hypothetical protein [Teredinibacter sp. KSP-S5-2]WNO10417.1 hypothetical protein P5V12_04460 [Teredinibacter sp. KSP-S5-2]